MAAILDLNKLHHLEAMSGFPLTIMTGLDRRARSFELTQTNMFLRFPFKVSLVGGFKF